MSEAELYVMKQRLVEAVRAKARRGAFCFALPPGYVWDEAGRVQKSPDEQVRTTLELIFARFEQIGTAHGLWVALCEEGIQIPVRSGRGGHLKWRWPNPAAVLRMLQNPVYACPEVTKGRCLCLRPAPGGGIPR